MTTFVLPNLLSLPCRPILVFGLETPKANNRDSAAKSEESPLVMGLRGDTFEVKEHSDHNILAYPFVSVGINGDYLIQPAIHLLRPVRELEYPSAT